MMVAPFFFIGVLAFELGIGEEIVVSLLLDVVACIVIAAACCCYRSRCSWVSYFARKFLSSALLVMCVVVACCGRLSSPEFIIHNPIRASVYMLLL